MMQKWTKFISIGNQIINARNDVVDDPDIHTDLPTPLPLKEKDENENTEWIKFINTDLNNIRLEEHDLKAIQSLRDTLSSTSITLEHLKEIRGTI